MEPRLGPPSPCGQGSVFPSGSFPHRRRWHLLFGGDAQSWLRWLPPGQDIYWLALGIRNTLCDPLRMHRTAALGQSQSSALGRVMQVSWDHIRRRQGPRSLQPNCAPLEPSPRQPQLWPSRIPLKVRWGFKAAGWWCYICRQVRAQRGQPALRSLKSQVQIIDREGWGAGLGWKPLHRPHYTT